MRLWWNTPNKRLPKGFFISTAGGEESITGWALWPIIWYEPKRNPSTDITLWRIGLAWLKWRIRITLGRQKALPENIDIIRDGLDKIPLLNKDRNTKNKKYLGKQAIIDGLENFPMFTPIIVIGAAHTHYGKLILSNEWTQKENTKESISGMFSNLSD